ncbi:MAG: hypothetical protein HN336_05850 [Lentimicrobiaceae bacterium]|jgi:hypothetical protein|nr:hypothetical protein [Lentimicrobiaceae bacterium]MCP4911209.1 hypothetical protein [Bacteroidota bacterium]MBT3454953.1 hypothetical protein [Lentimicrobiaceae bacterium]MBT3818421.1 hypothetical protein [Lentimicrobiaceae bacterium]MBT4060789.1 hypothetical protein [Lentimicrobiaceae bacterium]
MICIKVTIPEEICKIDDELKAIYHSKDSVCIWIFKTRHDRNVFMEQTVGMTKLERENYYNKSFSEGIIN